MTSQQAKLKQEEGKCRTVNQEQWWCVMMQTLYPNTTSKVPPGLTSPYSYPACSVHTGNRGWQCFNRPTDRHKTRHWPNYSLTRCARKQGLQVWTILQFQSLLMTSLNCPLVPPSTRRLYQAHSLVAPSCERPGWAHSLVFLTVLKTSQSLPIHTPVPHIQDLA